MSDETTYFKFHRDGSVHELTRKFHITEIVWMNRALGIDLSDCGQATQTLLGMFMVVRRTDKSRWNAKAFESMTTEDFEVLDGLPEDLKTETAGTEADPTGATAVDVAPETATN